MSWSVGELVARQRDFTGVYRSWALNLTPMIAVAGENFVDLTTAKTARPTRCRAAHRSTWLARSNWLEVPCALLGAVADDAFGLRLRRLLVADGVDDSCFVSGRLPMTSVLAALDDARAARYRFYTQGTAAPSLTVDAALAPYRLED